MKNQDYLMIGKALYLKKIKTLVIGDLHLGYEEMLHEEGVMIPLKQINQTIDSLREIFKELNKRKLEVLKIVLLGDIKHQFKYKKQEKSEVFELFDFLRKYVQENNIIIIRGNHDTISLRKKFKEIYIEEEIAFIHGDKDFLQLWDKKIKTIIMGHEHPGIVLGEKEGAKKEKYKCFLEGTFKGKKIIILPSFLEITIGNNFLENELNNSILPLKDKSNFNVLLVNDNLKEEALNFGKLKNL